MMDAHNERFLKDKIEHREENVRSKLRQVKELTKRMESKFDASSAASLATIAAELAANARSLEDLMEVAEMPREINLKDEE